MINDILEPLLVVSKIDGEKYPVKIVFIPRYRRAPSGLVRLATPYPEIRFVERGSETRPNRMILLKTEFNF